MDLENPILMMSHRDPKPQHLHHHLKVSMDNVNLSLHDADFKWPTIFFLILKCFKNRGDKSWDCVVKGLSIVSYEIDYGVAFVILQNFTFIQ